MMLLAAVRLGPPRPRPRPVGGNCGGSLFLAKDWLASFQLYMSEDVLDYKGRGYP